MELLNETSMICDEKEIERYIDEEIEECLTLEYKAAGSLSKESDKKPAITKNKRLF